jgi:hypothetical protein
MKLESIRNVRVVRLTKGEFDLEDLRDQIINFCNIQLSIIEERETKLRKEILDCKIQKEFLTSVLADVYEKTSKVFNRDKES